MTENIFFDLSKLKKIGQNVIIGKTVRIRYPELVEIGDNVIIDDFTYISTALCIGNNVHIPAGCNLIGGKNAKIKIGDFSTLGSNSVLAAGSDDFYAGIASPLVPLEFKGRYTIGEITIGRHCIVGPNSVVLPNIIINDGAAAGALTLVNKNLEAWKLYSGHPARFVKSRDRDSILKLEDEYKKHYDQ